MENVANTNNSINNSFFKPAEQAVYKDFKLPESSLKGIILTQPANDKFENEKDKKRSLVAKCSAGAAVGLAIFGIVLSPKFLSPKNTAKIKNMMGKLTGNISEKAAPISSKANILNNVNTVKDSYAKKIYEKIPILNKPLKWLDEASSKLYRNTGIGMTAKKITKAGDLSSVADKQIKGILGNMGEDELSRIVKINGVEKTAKQWGEEALSLRGKSKEYMEKFFGEKAQKKYVDDMDEIFDGIDVKFRDKFEKETLKDVKNKKYDKLFDFTIKDMVEGDKTRITKNMVEGAEQISKTNKEAQDILDAILDPDINRLEVQPLLKRVDKHFNKAVDTQKNDLFDKMRDIAAGSAPSDVLGIMGSTAMLGLYTAQAKTKEERTSVAFNTGIPLGLGIIGSTLATMKMISGFKAIGIGAVITMISGVIGKSLDKAYKKKHGIENKETTIPTLQIPKGLENNYITSQVDNLSDKAINIIK